MALRAILPVWKMTPVKILQREAAAPLIHHSLDYLCEPAGIRMHRHESKHPLRRKTKNAYTSSRPTRLERTAPKCPAIVELSDPLLDSEPWETHLFGGADKCLIATGGTGNKKNAAANFSSCMRSLHPLDMVVYLDGSQEISKSGDPLGAGAGWTINWVGNWDSTQGVPLGDTQQFYDAEVTTMLGGLNAALKSPMARVSLGLHICLDNLSVARNAGLTPKGSSQEIFRRFREAAKSWLQVGKRLSVQWIPGQMPNGDRRKRDCR